MCCFCLKLLDVNEIGIRILQVHFVICYVMLHSEQLLPNLLKRWKLSSVKLISKRIHVCEVPLEGQQSSKLVIVGQNSANRKKR